MLGAVAAFIIERNFFKAAAFAFSSAVLTFFGLMHGKKIGFNQTPDVAVSYSLEGLVLVGCMVFVRPSAPPVEEEEEEAELARKA